jgi:hypothetical protein
MAMTAIICTVFIAGCTEIAPIEIPETATIGPPGQPDPPPPPPPPPYDPITDPANVALREWKATPNLPQVFVWFDNWAGGTAGQYSLSGLPDSVTIASNWGQPKWGLSEMQKTDMEYVQKVKGTKVVVTLFSAKVGDDVDPDPIYTVENSTDAAVIGPAIKKYAEAIYDKVIAEGYDGYDWDYEPAGGGGTGNYLWTVPAQRKLFVQELGYWFGKSAATRTDRGDRKPVDRELLFLIDGEIGIRGRMDKDWESYNVDYFVLQTYGITTSGLPARVSGVITDMSDWISANVITKEEVVRRTILTENFESYNGANSRVLDQSKYIHTADGINQQIGGFGIYRVGFDYRSYRTFQGSTEYGYLREGINNLYNIYRSRQ